MLYIVYNFVPLIHNLSVCKCHSLLYLATWMKYFNGMIQTVCPNTPTLSDNHYPLNFHENKVYCSEILLLWVKELQKALLGQEIEWFYGNLSSVFQFKSWHDCTGRRAYFGRQSVTDRDMTITLSIVILSSLVAVFWEI